MKIAILTTLLSTATAFVVPSANTNVRAPTFLRETVESEEAVETEFKGSEAISALTSGLDLKFSSEEISKILPHRYPFLLVDKVVEYEAGKVRIIFFESDYFMFHSCEVSTHMWFCEIHFVV